MFSLKTNTNHKNKLVVNTMHLLFMDISHDNFMAILWQKMLETPFQTNFLLVKIY